MPSVLPPPGPGARADQPVGGRPRGGHKPFAPCCTFEALRYVPRRSSPGGGHLRPRARRRGVLPRLTKECSGCVPPPRSVPARHATDHPATAVAGALLAAGLVALVRPGARPRRRLPLLVGQRRDRRRRLRARHRLQPVREGPGVRPDRHRRRLPARPVDEALGPAARPRRLGRLGPQRRPVAGDRPGEPEQRVRRRRHVHEQLGPEQRRDPAVVRPRRDVDEDQPAVQGRRQHARPRHGRAAADRPQRQPRPVLRHRGRQRPVAEHRLRRHLGQGLQLPQRGQLRGGPQRPERVPHQQPGRRLGDLRPDERHQGLAHQDDLRRRRRQGEHASTGPPTPVSTWSRIAGQPTGYIAHKGVFDAEGKQLYIATSDTGGPYDGGHGDIWRLDAATGAWTRSARSRRPAPTSTTGTAA